MNNMKYIICEIAFQTNLEYYVENPNRYNVSWTKYFFREEDYDLNKDIKNDVAREICAKIKCLCEKKDDNQIDRLEDMGNFFEYVLSTSQNISADDLARFLEKSDCAITFCTGFSNSEYAGQWIETSHDVDMDNKKNLNDSFQQVEE